MDLAALSALLAAVRTREPQRRIILFGSAALLAALPMGADSAFDIESTLDADILLDHFDRCAIDAGLAKSGGNDARFSALVAGIVTGEPSSSASAPRQTEYA